MIKDLGGLCPPNPLQALKSLTKLKFLNVKVCPLFKVAGFGAEPQGFIKRGHMNIIVCIKQVPGTTKVAVDEETGVLLRSGIESKMNPYDLYALETALKIGGSVNVITMGPPQAEAVVREAFAMGADGGTILSDRVFAGADVLATSYTLSQGIKANGKFDLIICGKQTTDGDTAQVGPELAEFLDIPHVTNVAEINLLQDNFIRVTADMGEYMEIFDIELPCLITVDKGIYVPRLPSYKKMLASADREIKILSADDLSPANAAMFGLNGSPTKVEKIYPPDARNERRLIEGDSETVALTLYKELCALKFV